MINELIKLATHLDAKGYHKEANYLDTAIEKHALLGFGKVKLSESYCQGYTEQGTGTSHGDIMKKMAADINYKRVKIASNNYYLKYRNTPKLGSFVRSLREDGWDVKLSEGYVTETLAHCLDGTDDCNRKTLVQPLTLTKGTEGDQDGTYAEMDMTYREHYYKDQG